MTTVVREKFSSQAAPEMLAALRQIAESPSAAAVQRLAQPLLSKNNKHQF